MPKGNGHFFSSKEKQQIIEILSHSKGNYEDAINQLEAVVQKKYAKLEIISKKYEFLRQNASDLICIINKNFKFESINKNIYYERLNYESSELIGKPVLEFVHPDDREKTLEALKKGVDKGYAISEFRFKNKRGDWLWIEARGSSFKDLDGEIKGIVVSKDITDQKETQLELKKTELKYKTLIENLFDVVMILDLKGTIKFVSLQIKSNFGYDKEDVLGHKVFEYIHPEDLPVMLNEFKKFTSSNQILTTEYRAKNKNGKYVWVKSRGKIIEYGKRKSIIGTMRKTEEKKKALAKLKESEEKYKDIAELLPDMIYEADTSKKITYLNSKGHEMLGYNKNDLEKGINLVDIVHDSYKKEAAKNIIKLLNGEEIRAHKYLMLRKDDSTFYARVNSRPIYKNGEIIGLRGTVSNINKMILAQEKIKKSEKKLKKLNQLKSELLRRTSHELKTPLVSIKGFTNLLLELNEDDLEESSIEIVSEIKQGCDRLENLISDILMAAKLESGKIQINKEKINLSKLITNAVKSLRGIAKSRKQSIKLEINKDLYIQGDPKRILEVIENLILNAIKYTPSKGTIIIKSESSKKDVIISIDDTGIGFTEEEKKDLFKQFGKIERYGAGHDVNIDGSGLGLYISRKIIEIHGGKIWMESEGRNKGSTFFFSLPLVD